MYSVIHAKDYPINEQWKKKKDRKTVLHPLHVQMQGSPFLPLFSSKVVFFHVFIPVLFLYFYKSILLEMKFSETFSIVESNLLYVTLSQQ